MYEGFGDLSMHTIATNATHSNGLVELDVHNLWGYVPVLYDPMVDPHTMHTTDTWKNARRISPFVVSARMNAHS